jgi:hypothetical protein
MENEDRVPRSFNRHATANTVGSQQYSRRNAVRAAWFSFRGLLKFIDEEAAAREASVGVAARSRATARTGDHVWLVSGFRG